MISFSIQRYTFEREKVLTTLLERPEKIDFSLMPKDKGKERESHIQQHCADLRVINK